MKSEKELRQLLHQGDEKAIRIIFDEFYEGMCKYAATITKSHPVAEEIVEDIFIYLWINAAVLNITTSLKNYLYKSVYNNCLKFLQKEKKEEQQLDAHRGDKDHELLYSTLYRNPESDLILQELEKKAETIMEGLPAQCREIYILSRIENLSYSQIAEKLKITAGTVKTQMSRAFQRFREEFGEFLPMMAVAGSSALTALFSKL
jgi:RNA polymerase sigma-70 factor, ECF subfamily